MQSESRTIVLIKIMCCMFSQLNQDGKTCVLVGYPKTDHNHYGSEGDNRFFLI